MVPVNGSCRVRETLIGEGEQDGSGKQDEENELREIGSRRGRGEVYDFDFSSVTRSPWLGSSDMTTKCASSLPGLYNRCGIPGGTGSPSIGLRTAWPLGVSIAISPASMKRNFGHTRGSAEPRSLRSGRVPGSRCDAVTSNDASLRRIRPTGIVLQFRGGRCPRLHRHANSRMEY